MKTRGLVLGSILLLAAASAQAGVIFSPLSATASSEFSGDYDIGNTIDHSGLFTNFTSGVTDWDTYFAGNPQHDFIAIDNEWFTAPNVLSATIGYDMGSIMTWNRMAFWNDEFSGVGTIEVQASIDNITFSSIASGLTPTNHSGAVTQYPADIFTLGTFSARYIRLNVSNCPQPDELGPYCGIGEVAFEQVPGVPEPSAVSLLAIALAGLGVAGRRKR